MKKIICLMLAALLCVAVLCGCAKKTEDTASDSVPFTETIYTDEALVGEVFFISDEALAVYIYNTEDDITKPETIDVSALTTELEEANVLISKDAVYNQAIDGEIYTGYIDPVETGTLIAINYSPDGTQIITVIGKIEEETEQEVPFSTDIAGSVTSAENGAFTLDVFESPSFVITDYANADFTTYEATGAVLTYTPADGAAFKLADNGTLLDASQSDILVGDMLIITTDDNGSETVYIYHTDNSAEEETAEGDEETAEGEADAE